jgi:predicted Rossmann fold flavoprotein
MSQYYDIIIVGGGAAGFFCAINAVEMNSTLKVAILERGQEVLSKVRISGGGRCNVTHACYDPRELVQYYPRGEKELRGPFHTFAAGDTVEWFERHGVALKAEEDGRMFPVTDSSQTIIDCLVSAAKRLGIEILTGQSVKSIYRKEQETFKIDTQSSAFVCDKLVMATGSNPKIWEMLKELGHDIIAPVPSLFTFNIKDPRIRELPGISANATVKVIGTNLESFGPLLITHWGMSGPAILKLSAWGARILAGKNYQFDIAVNWLNAETEDIGKQLRELRLEHARKVVLKRSPFGLANRLWESIVTASGITADTKWADLSKKQMTDLAQQLTAAIFRVNGKSTFKEEFVTAGGLNLKEINFKTMESKLHSKLFFAGEIIDVDAITGGFNFQNAWTTGYLVAKAINITHNVFNVVSFPSGSFRK